LDKKSQVLKTAKDSRVSETKNEKKKDEGTRKKLVKKTGKLRGSRGEWGARGAYRVGRLSWAKRGPAIGRQISYRRASGFALI